jgi:peptidyl-dipeptidase A
MILVCVLVAFLALGVHGQGSEEEAERWANVYNIQAELLWSESTEADWTYNTNLTDYNMEKSVEAATAAARFDKAMAFQASLYDWQNFVDPVLKRQFSKIVEIGAAILEEDDYVRMTNLGNEMQRIYSTAEVCNKPGDTSGACYPLDPDLTDILNDQTSDWETLLWAWKGWRDVSGKLMPDMYKEFSDLLNKAAVINGYDDNGAYWRSWYEMEDFPQMCEDLWLELEPLYKELHAYVRRKLMEKFPMGEFPTEGHIPAHLLGNMWAQSWDALEELVRPAPDSNGVDVTDEMVAQNYTALKMFELSDEFFKSLGLIAMPQSFWDKSMITKPPDRDVVCHASAWDFYNRVDFRIKQCTDINMDQLFTVHHEMGHIEYFLQYKDQPVRFRDGANPGFHEAIGDTLSLSVSTPEHLMEIGLLPNFVDDPDGDLNFLMSQALQKIAFIPFGYLIDQWRWDLFSGAITQAQYNSRWWEHRCRYQGVSPPVPRSSSDFDPGAKYHVPGNTPYIRYFIAHILQFQFHKSLCDAAGNTGPLHRCDIYKSVAAGDRLGAMLSLGSSVPWPDALEQISSTREMSVQPLLEYFRPLRIWLEEQNAGHPKGWTDACPPGSVIP